MGKERNETSEKYQRRTKKTTKKMRKDREEREDRPDPVETDIGVLPPLIVLPPLFVFFFYFLFLLSAQKILPPLIVLPLFAVVAAAVLPPDVNKECHQLNNLYIIIFLYFELLTIAILSAA